MHNRVRKRDGTLGDIYFFYATCPHCAKAHFKNHVFGVAKTRAA